jgi:transcriptional regulator GlxA family with amidase domain
MDGRVARAIAVMEAQLHRRLRVGDLARGLGLSDSRFARLFRQETGSPPGAYLHALRMARARILVERTCLPVAVVMAQVGLSDPSHFARDFRRAHGLSPRALRQQLRMTAQPWRLPAADRSG